MYKRILMVADYEPWWQFDDIEEKFTEVIHFETFEEYLTDTLHLLKEMRSHYAHEEVRNSIYYAFWNEGEFTYCEGCDEELQVYYGVILSHPIVTLV